MPITVLTQLKSLRDGVAQELRMDPRYRTLQALDKSIAEITSVLSSAGLLPAGAPASSLMARLNGLGPSPDALAEPTLALAETPAAAHPTTGFRPTPPPESPPPHAAAEADSSPGFKDGTVSSPPPAVPHKNLASFLEPAAGAAAALIAGGVAAELLHEHENEKAAEASAHEPPAPSSAMQEAASPALVDPEPETPHDPAPATSTSEAVPPPVSHAAPEPESPLGLAAPDQGITDETAATVASPDETVATPVLDALENESPAVAVENRSVEASATDEEPAGISEPATVDEAHAHAAPPVEAEIAQALAPPPNVDNDTAAADEAAPTHSAHDDQAAESDSVEAVSVESEAVPEVHQTEAVREDAPVQEHEPVVAHEPVQAHEAAQEHEPVQAHEAVQEHEPVQEHEAVQEHEPVQEHEAVQEHEPVQEHEAVQQHEPVQEHEAVQGHEPVQEHEAVQEHEPVQEHEAVQQHEPVQAHEAVQEHEPVQEHEAVQQHEPVQEHEAVTAHEPAAVDTGADQPPAAAEAAASAIEAPSSADESAGAPVDDLPVPAPSDHVDPTPDVAVAESEAAPEEVHAGHDTETAGAPALEAKGPEAPVAETQALDDKVLDAPAQDRPVHDHVTPGPETGPTTHAGSPEAAAAEDQTEREASVAEDESPIDVNEPDVIPDGKASGYIAMAAKPAAPLYAPSIAVKFGKLPNKVDLRPLMTAVEDQGETKSCVANAVAGAYEYWIKKASKRDVTISRQFVYYNARWRDSAQDADAGSVIQFAMEGLQKFGAASEAAWPRDPRLLLQKPGSEAYHDGAPYRVHDMAQVPLKLEAWKQALAEGKPIVFGLVLFSAFNDCTDRGGVVPMPAPREIARRKTAVHAMCAVGYSESEKVFIVRNSWGKDWGDKGYCYIPYDYMLNSKFNDGDAWVFVPKVPSQPPRETWQDATAPVTRDGQGVDFTIQPHRIEDYDAVAADLFERVRRPWVPTIPEDYGTAVAAVSKSLFSELESFDVKSFLEAEASETAIGGAGEAVASEEASPEVEAASLASHEVHAAAPVAAADAAAAGDGPENAIEDALDEADEIDEHSDERAGREHEDAEAMYEHEGAAKV